MRIRALRPHHLLDLVRDYAPPEGPEPDRPDGANAVPQAAHALAENLDRSVRFVVGPDDICAPCSHLQADGRCDRILDRHVPPEPIDEYNDPLDRRILARLGLDEGAELTIGEFLRQVAADLDAVAAVCTHPTEVTAERLAGLRRGLRRLGLAD